METPDRYPNVPYAAFVDSVGPAINAEFLNLTEEGLQDIIGGLWGRSAALLRDEYTERSYPAGKFGTFEVITATNVNKFQAAPGAPGVMGEWGVSCAVPGVSTWLAIDNENYIDTFDFTLSIKVRVDAHAELDVAAVPGFGIGLTDLTVLADMVKFVAGSNLVNWQVNLNGVLFDTGIPVVDGQYYELQIARKNGAITAYIDGVVVFTGPYATSLVDTCRIQQMNLAAGTTGNGYQIDYFHAILMR